MHTIIDKNVLFKIVFHFLKINACSSKNLYTMGNTRRLLNQVLTRAKGWGKGELKVWKCTLIHQKTIEGV